MKKGIDSRLIYIPKKLTLNMRMDSGGV